ncbi:MAG: hypothetical protein Q9N62_01465 [Ghiorsea sp.]|nr:hypothetical protein [Ghiorsea sp.]
MEIILRMWKDPVWSKVISVGIITAMGFLISYFTGCWPTLITYLNNTWDWLFQTTSISNWLLICISIPCLLVLYVLMLWIKSLGEAEDNFQSYQSDTFFGLKWRWSYCYGKILDDDVHCFCSSCDHQVFPQNVSSYQVVPRFKYDCPDCNNSIGVIEEVSIN